MPHGSALSTTEGLPGGDDPALDDNLRRRRALYTVTSFVLALLMLLAVIDALSLADTYGIDTAHARASGGGYDLDVRYSTVSRGALATPFEIHVRRPGGFDGPVTIAVSHEYMKLWDENGFYPTPSSETTMGPWLLWEFDRPEGDTLHFSYDGRIEPAAQRGRAGRVAVVEDATPVVEVSFRTRVLP